MRRPFGLRIDRRTPPRRTLLRAGNSIDSVGAGPVELRGRRGRSRRFMDAVQSIYTRRRAPADLPHRRAAAVQVRPRQPQLLEVLPRGLVLAVAAGLRRATAPRRVRTGPKIAYCLRDLRQDARDRPAPPRVPRVQHEPARAPRGAGHVARLVGRLPARLPRAVDRRDGPARLLRLPAHGRPPQLDPRVRRDQQPLDGDRAPAVPPPRRPALPGPGAAARRPRRPIRTTTTRHSARVIRSAV